MKQLVIFDLDGTLLNTIQDLGNAANYALAKEGFPTHHISAYPHFVGNGISKLIERTLPVDNRDAETIQRIRSIFMEYYDEHCTDCTTPYPGIPELLEDLNTNGIAMAVATNKYQSAANKIVNHYFPDIPWTEICGQREGFPTKPDPSIIFSILANHPTPKAGVLYVGDSAVDIETGRRACVDTIGVSWGFRPVSELVKAYAPVIVDRPSAILDIAKK